MDTFYVSPRNVSAQSLTIEGDELSHLTHVMRKKTGDSIRVADGIGHAYDAVITEVSRTAALCRIAGHYHRLNEPGIEITIAAGLLKNSSSFDFLVEKCTELGATAIVPLLTERTIPRNAKTDRWQKIALSAMKQSGRCVLPIVRDPAEFGAFVRSIPESYLRVIPHEQVKSPGMSGVGSGQEKHAVVCIGPEGGFTEFEIAEAGKAGFTPVSLGVRRLRAETAAIVSCAALSLSK